MQNKSVQLKLPTKSLKVIAIVKYERNRPPIPSDCPGPFADIIKACWSHEPDDRPTAQEVLEMLDKNMLVQKQ